LLQLGIITPAVHHDDLAQIDDAAGIADLRVALACELACLGADQRAAVRLRVVDELPYAVVAQRLGVSEATARARVSRGLRALSLALEPTVSIEGAKR
jgi:RNA polymerase sigma-70 factor (ECF subfamily)